MKQRQDAKKRNRILRRYQFLGLEEKIRYAVRLVEAGLALADHPAVAWSGGKDSTVLLHLARQFLPDIIVAFSNSGVEFPETLRFVRRLKKEWSLNLHVARPGRGKGFWWCVENRGWPILGKAFARRKPGFYSDKQAKVMTSGVSISASCCWHCKEKPAIDMQRKLGVDLLFLGIMAGESRQRRLCWFDYGDFFWTKKGKIWKVHPLSIWVEDDIWEYHRRFDLPLCDLYKMGHKRNGCWPCMMDIAMPGNHMSIMRRTHPRLWRFLIVDKGLGKELQKIKLALNDRQADLFSTTWPIEELIEQRPCFFDRL